MNKLFTCLLALLCLLHLVQPCTTQAQQNPPDSLSIWLSLTTGALNPPTGYLYDKTYHPTPTRWYNGTNDSLITPNVMHWLTEQSNNMYVRSFNSPMNWQEISNWATYYHTQNKILLPIIALRYDTIRADALSLGLLTQNPATGLLTENPAATQSPYNQDILFAAAPLPLSNIGMPNPQFIIEPHCLISNLGIPQTMTIDFGDGTGTHPIAFGTPIAPNYAQGGTKNVVLTCFFDNNQTLRANMSFFYNDNTGLTTYDALKGETSFLIQADIPYGTNTTIIGYNNVINPRNPDIVIKQPIMGEVPAKNQGYITVKYGKDPATGATKTQITQPILFIEGIDFGLGEDVPIFNKFELADGYKYGSLGFIDIKNGKTYNIEDGKEIEEISEEFGLGPQMMQELYQLGYDVVYLDFVDGADYMQRNAFVLVKLIQEINRLKQSTEELVIIAASMGGQVGKYALSYMEKNQLPHCTRELMLFDSPNQGANIPIALQSFLKWGSTSTLKSVVAFKYKKICRPAAQQLLYGHAISNGGISPLRTDWLADLQQIGNYPQQTRLTTLINGSSAKQETGYTPGAKLFKGRTATFITVSLVSAALLPVVLTGGMGCDAYAACGDTTSNGNVIFRGNDVGYKNEIKIRPHSTCQTLDHIPGAQRKKDMAELNYGFKNTGLKAEQPNFCFIPTISALDLNTTNFSFDVLNVLEKNNRPHPLHPFEAYFAPTDNESHVQITQPKIDWVKAQIEGSRTRPIALPYTAGTQLHTTYNYGNGTTHRLSTCNINSGGTLYINNYAPVRYGIPNVDLESVENSTFRVYVSSECVAAVVTVASGGSLVLGNGIPVQNPNKGILTLQAGSKMVVQAGGTLVINAKSKLVIDAGAELVLEDGANLHILGDSTSLHIAGTLTLHGSHDIFGLQKGKIVFAGTPSIATSTAASLRISGTAGAPSYRQASVVLLPNTTLHIASGVDISVAHCNLTMGSNSHINALSHSASLSYVVATAPILCTNSSINLFATQAFDINNSTFEWVPITAMLSSYGGNTPPQVTHNYFRGTYNNNGGSTSLKITGGAPQVTHNTFENGYIGYHALGNMGSSLVYKNTFDSHGKAGILNASNVGNATLIKDCTFGNNKRAIELLNTHTRLECNTIGNSENAGVYAYKGILSMNNNANNTIRRTTWGAAIHIDNIQKITINNGYNQLTQNVSITGSMRTKAIAGSVISNVYACNVGSPMLCLDAHQNNFERNASGYLLSPNVAVIHTPISIKQQTMDCKNMQTTVLNEINDDDLKNNSSYTEILSGISTYDTKNDDIQSITQMLKVFDDLKNPEIQSQSVALCYNLYPYLLRAVGNAYTHNTLERNKEGKNGGKPTQILQQVTEALDDLDKLPWQDNELSNDRNHSTDDLTLQKALLYYQAQHYDLALQVLGTIGTHTTKNTLENYWNCVIQTESDFVQGKLSAKEYLLQSTYCADLQPIATDEKTVNSEEKNAKRPELSILPNPTENTSFVQIYVPESSTATIAITNVLGKVVHMQALHSGAQTVVISAAQLSAGVYYLTLNIDDQIATQQKWVVTK
jgi:hypothetical protein